MHLAMSGTPPQIKVGAFNVAFLADGLWRNDGGCMFGVVPRELWKGNHPPDERNRIRLNLTCPLIMKGGDAILVDTGIGNRLSDVERKIFDHGDGWLPQHLKRARDGAGRHHASNRVASAFRSLRRDRAPARFRRVRGRVSARANFRATR